MEPLAWISSNRGCACKAKIFFLKNIISHWVPTFTNNSPLFLFRTDYNFLEISNPINKKKTIDCLRQWGSEIRRKIKLISYLFVSHYIFGIFSH